MRPRPTLAADNYPHRPEEKPPRGVYGEWCQNPALCAGKGYCPREPTCAD